MLHLNDYRHKKVVFLHSDEDHIRFGNENFIVEEKDTGTIKNQMPCSKIFAVFVIGNTTITSVLLEKASIFGFQIIFMKYNFRPYAVVGSLAEGNTILRKLQYSAGQSQSIALRLVVNKTENQLDNLQHIRNKSISVKTAIERLQEIIEKLKTCQSIEDSALLGLEGNASKIYFKAYFEELGWSARRPRVKHDALNCMLDIGYTYLFQFIESHLKLFGFDLYVGVYHKLFYQRKSLVCDLVEPFRALIDRTILKGFHLKQFQESDFIVTRHQYQLRKNKNRDYTKVLFESIYERREEIFIYIRDYYRAFIRSKPIAEYPEFRIDNANREL